MNILRKIGLLILIVVWLGLGYLIYCIARTADGQVVPGQVQFVIPGRKYISPAGLHCTIPDITVECAKE